MMTAMAEYTQDAEIEYTQDAEIEYKRPNAWKEEHQSRSLSRKVPEAGLCMLLSLWQC